MSGYIAETIVKITEQAVVQLYEIELVVIYGLFAVVSLSLLANFVVWWFLCYIWFTIVRTTESMHEKVALADDLLCARIVPGSTMAELCPLAGTNFVNNEFEICAKMQKQQDELRQRGVAPKVFVYMPDEVSEFHATKHQLWECSPESSAQSSDSFRVHMELMSKSAAANDAR